VRDALYIPERRVDGGQGGTGQDSGLSEQGGVWMGDLTALNLLAAVGSSALQRPNHQGELSYSHPTPPCGWG